MFVTMTFLSVDSIPILNLN